MQSAKDTFYQTLRGRLLAINPDRTVLIRGVSRPGVLVDENETESVRSMPDCFHLQWTKAAVVMRGERPLWVLRCELGYATAGTTMNSGLDRGRCLAAMDAELLLAVAQGPQNVVKVNSAGLAMGLPAVPMQTRLWWSDAELGEVQRRADRLERKAVVEVMSLQEAGEL